MQKTTQFTGQKNVTLEKEIRPETHEDGLVPQSADILNFILEPIALTNGIPCLASSGVISRIKLLFFHYLIEPRKKSFDGDFK
jgi:hypothetical protein